jgi:hypothetical protein
MPRRLVLHIGYYKTGTTALQDQLSHLRSRLEDQGVLYPRAGRPVRGNSSHSGLSFQELHRVRSHLPFWYRTSNEFTDFTSGNVPPAREELLAEIVASNADTVIISSEEFIRFGSNKGVPAEQVKDMIRALRVDHVTIVCYVRRPDRYLESWYNQLVKMAIPIARLSTAMTREPRPGHRYYCSEHTDVDRMIEYWACQVGCDELIVRDYDNLHNGNILDDFGVAIGLRRIDAADVPQVRPNPRIDNNFVEYARVWSLFRPREDHRELHRLLERMAKDPNLPRRFKVFVLGPRARRRLHAYAAPVNERLGKLVGARNGYFADLDEMLTVPDGAKSDVAAFRFWAPYIDVAVRASRIADAPVIPA